MCEIRRLGYFRSGPHFWPNSFDAEPHLLGRLTAFNDRRDSLNCTSTKGLLCEQPFREQPESPDRRIQSGPAEGIQIIILTVKSYNEGQKNLGRTYS